MNQWNHTVLSEGVPLWQLFLYIIIIIIIITGEGRGSKYTIISRSLSAFHWRVDDVPTLKAGLEAL